MSVTINNIEFKNITGLDKTSSKFAFVNKSSVTSAAFEKLAPSSTTEQYLSRYALVNGLQIDWNGAELKNNSEIKATLNTHGESLSSPRNSM
ncbi:MAG: hypothetical protein J6S02_01985 [Bacteroidaceae bacterium]|nr:hypothetical protein [Bacteroidaceae bacterium]